MYVSGDSSIIQVMIAGTECVIVSSTPTEIICDTNSYAYSTIKALVHVTIAGFGEAINVYNYIVIYSHRPTPLIRLTRDSIKIESGL